MERLLLLRRKTNFTQKFIKKTLLSLAVLFSCFTIQAQETEEKSNSQNFNETKRSFSSSWRIRNYIFINQVRTSTSCLIIAFKSSILTRSCSIESL